MMKEATWSCLRRSPQRFDILRIIEPELGPHEVVYCVAAPLPADAIPCQREQFDFIGYDLAYPGGDFYSAVLNGVFVNPDESLVCTYKSLLNEYGLFQTIDSIAEYLAAFRRVVMSEAEAVFWTYSLHTKRAH